MELENKNKLFDNESVTGLLSEGTQFEGNLSFEGTVRIGGEFKGEVFTKDTLIITSSANIKADIEAETVILSGHLEGSIQASKQVVMCPPAVFKGSVSTPSLKIQEGVIFEGASYMEKTSKKVLGCAEVSHS